MLQDKPDNTEWTEVFHPPHGLVSSSYDYEVLQDYLLPAGAAADPHHGPRHPERRHHEHPHVLLLQVGISRYLGISTLYTNSSSTA